jgi:hypothetical protein
MEINNETKNKKVESIEINDLLKDKYITQFKLIDVRVIQKILKYRDLRSTLNWCRGNGLFILEQGRSKTVNEIEFILSYYEPFIQNLKRKHINWKEMFLNYLNGDFNQLLSSSDMKPQNIGKDVYKPKSKSTQSFLNDMRDI